MRTAVAIFEHHRVRVGIVGVERVFDAEALYALSHETIGDHHGHVIGGVIFGIVVETDVTSFRIALDELLVKLIGEAAFAKRGGHVAESGYPERQRINDPFAENDCVRCTECFRVPNAYVWTFQVPVSFVFGCPFGDSTAVKLSGFAFAEHHRERNATAHRFMAGFFEYAKCIELGSLLGSRLCLTVWYAMT